MKKAFVSFVFMALATVALCQVLEFSPEYYEAAKPEVLEAARKGAYAKLIYRVVDDEGKPVTNTLVSGTWRNEYPRRKDIEETFITDTNGQFVAKRKVKDSFGCYIKKDGFYDSGAAVNFHWRKGVPGPWVENGKWVPYGEERTIILKRIRMPTKLNRFESKWLDCQDTNIWVGLDFELHDWTPPYGNGKNADVLLRFNDESTSPYNLGRMVMDVSFTNNMYAGMYEIKRDLYSKLQHPYFADTNAVYAASRTFVCETQTEPALPENKAIVFRTRTKVDENNKLISAHYGILYGTWETGRGMKARMIFFNETPNDPNLEAKLHDW